MLSCGTVYRINGYCRIPINLNKWPTESHDSLYTYLLRESQLLFRHTYYKFKYYQTGFSLCLRSLRKYAYSNILKILPPKNENFQIKNSDIFHVSAQNIDCGYSLEPPH